MTNEIKIGETYRNNLNRKITARVSAKVIRHSGTEYIACIIDRHTAYIETECFREVYSLDH